MKLFFCNSNVSSKLGFKPSFSRFFSGFTSKELIVNSDINNVLLYDGNNFKAVLFLPSLVAFWNLIEAMKTDSINNNLSLILEFKDFYLSLTNILKQLEPGKYSFGGTPLLLSKIFRWLLFNWMLY
uniref:Uncharacterized protein n=1 Tax=Gibberella zeae TaxID=5518 RepID=A0A0E3X4G9_GIBZA|nr:hypothetical protein [Fusarium graminearum]QID44572.1 hypothetical protein [Fusarium graminearum]QID44624.1 hypothetical protein [Fusarium graminearum]QID44676.1 hypothetical protein [Fusarium graminearum]QID44781.1 hypothetical protein [Fusarium graminearum]